VTRIGILVESLVDSLVLVREGVEGCGRFVILRGSPDFVERDLDPCRYRTRFDFRYLSLLLEFLITHCYKFLDTLLFRHLLQLILELLLQSLFLGLEPQTIVHMFVEGVFIIIEQFGEHIHRLLKLNVLSFIASFPLPFQHTQSFHLVLRL
jgi:hypothetical protein